MALNMMGLGFSFGAADKGLGKVIDKTTAGIGGISKLIKSVGGAAGKFSLRKMFQLPSQMIGTMQTIAHDTRVTTTMMEAFGVQAGKASRIATAGLNLTANQSKKARSEIASTAFSMNTDVGSIAASWKALKQNQIDVTKVGFKSFKQYSKFLSMTGTDAKEFAAGMGHMTHTLGMNNKEVKDLIETTVALGTKFDMGSEAVPGMLKNLKTMREVGAGLFKAWGKDRTTRFLHSATLVSGALMKSGLSADEAQASSNAFLQTIMKGKQSFHDLYTGIEKDLGPLAQVMAENFQGPEEAFRLLENAPHEFVLKMSKATNSLAKLAEKQVMQQMGIKDASNLSAKKRAEFDEKVRKQTLGYTQRFSTQMTKLTGANMTTLFMKSSDKTMKKMEELGKNFEKVGGKKGSISKLTKQYRDGRTASERFAIAQDLMITRMKKLKGTMSDTTFLKDYNKSSGLVLGKMKKMADKGGPVGKAMTTMIDFSNFGLGGVLARLHPMGLGLTTIIQKFAPLLAMLPALAVGFKALLSPFALLTVAIGGIYLALKYPEQAAKAFKKFSSAVKKNLPKILSTVKMIVFGVAKALANVMVYIWENIPWGKVMKALKWTAEKIGQGLKWALLKVIQISDWLIYSFSNIDFEAIRGYLAVGFKYAFGALLLAAGYVITRLPYLLKGAFKLMYAIIFGFFDGLRDYFAEQFPQLTKFFTVMFGVIKYAFVALTTYMIARWLALKVIAIKTAIATWAVEKGIWIKKEAIARKDQAVKAAVYAWEKAAAAASFVWKVGFSANWSVFEIGKILIVKAAWIAYYAAILFAAIPLFATLAATTAAYFLAQGVALVAAGIKWAVMWAIAGAPITVIIAGIAAVIAAVYMIVKHWGKIVNFFKKVGKWIAGVFKKLGKAIIWYVTLPIRAIKTAYNKLKGFFKGIGKAISGAFSKAGGWIKSKFTGALDFVRGDLVKFGGADFIKAMEEVKKNAENGAEGIKKPLTGALQAVKKEMGSTGGAGKGLMGDLADWAGAAAKDAMDFVVKHAAAAKQRLVQLGKEAHQILRGGNVGLLQKLAEVENDYYKARQATGKGALEKRKALSKQINLLQKKARQTLGDHYRDELKIYSTALIYRAITDKDVAAANKMSQIDKDKTLRRLRIMQNESAKNTASHLKRVAALEGESLEVRSKFTKASARMVMEQRGVFEIAKAATIGDIKNFDKILAAANLGRLTSTQKHMIKMRGLVMSERTKLIEGAQSTLKQIGARQNVLAKSITDGLAEYHRKKLNVIANSAKSVSEFTTRAAAEQKRFIAAQATLVAVASKARADAAAASMTDDQTEKLVAKRLEAQKAVFVGKMGKMGKEGGAKLTESLIKSFDVTKREAFSFLKQLTGTNRTRLIKDLGKVKKAYIDLLKGASTEGKKLLGKTRKEFKGYQDEFKKLWEDMLKYTNDYTKQIGGVVKRFFASLMASVNVGTTQMTAAAATMISTLQSSFSGFNLLDVLTSGGKIRDWALRIVQSLQQAFAGRNPFTTAIDLAARNSRAIIDAMAANRESRGTIRPITKMSVHQISSESARARVKDDLISATHSPLWSKKVIDQNDTTNRILEKGFKTLLMLQGSKSQQRSAQRELSAGIDLRGAGVDKSN